MTSLDEQFTKLKRKNQPFLDTFLTLSYSIDNHIRRWLEVFHVFGDSITKSVALEEDGNLRTVSDNFIFRATKAAGLPLNNRSLFGATLAKGRQLLKRFASDLSPGDTVLIAYGGNDCNLPWDLISENPELPAMAKMPLADFTLQLNEVIDELREKGLKPVLMNLLPLQPNRFFKVISKGLKADILLNWLGDLGAIYRWQEGYSLAIMETAARKSVPLFDARSVFLSHPHYEKLLCSDGMHMNDEGQSLLTEAFTEFLKKID